MQDTAAAVKGLAEGESESLKAVLDELQAAVPGGGAVSIATVAAAIRTALVAGGTATTALVVAGIGVGDHIVSVIQLDVAADTGTSATGNKVQNAVRMAGAPIQHRFCPLSRPSRGVASRVLPNRRFARGRILTMPLRRRSSWLNGHPYACRYVVQGGTVGLVAILLTPLVSLTTEDFVYWVPILLLWIDDWATGDDDKWKRLKGAARNAVKWRMVLPAPQRARTA